MKKTKISILSNALMFLSLSVMFFSYVPIVYAEDTTTEPIIEDSTTVEGLNTDNTQSIDEKVSNDSDEIPENNEGNDSDEEQKLIDNTSVITNEVTPSEDIQNDVTPTTVEDLQPTDSNDGEPTLTTGKAKIGDTYYATLSDAVNSITDGTPTTIEIIEDDLNASGIIVPEGRNIIFNFNGHTYNVTGNFAGSTGTKNQSFQLLKDSTIVMNNGTIKNANTSNSFIIQNYSNLTLTDMVLDGRDNSFVTYALSSNNGHVVINGSTSIYAANGRRAFDMCWAPNAGYPEGTQIVVDTTGTISGIIELDTWGGFKEGVPVVSTLLIKNIKHVGTFSIEEGFTDELTITGGDFSTMPNVSNLAEGLVVVANGDTYSVVEGKAKIGDTYYATLSDAINSITDGTNTTIEVLSDDLNASGIIVPSGRNITIDFGGHTYIVSHDYAGSSRTKTQAFQLLKDSNIVMKNGTVKITGADGKMIIQNYSNLTLTDMVINGGDNNNVLYALSNNNGEVLINGSTSISATEENVAFDVYGSGSYAGAHVVVDTTGTIIGTIELDGQDKSTLEINNIKHIGAFSVLKESLNDNLAINGGLYTTNMDASYLEEGYAVVPINNLYEVRKLDTSVLTVVEEDGNTYLCEKDVRVGYNGSIYISSEKKRYMFENGIVDKAYTGIIDLGSKYVYLVNGETAMTTSGIIDLEEDKYLLTNGEASFNGSQYFGSIMTRYMFVKGKVDKAYTGIIDLGSKYVYLVNGETAKNISGLTEIENDIYLLKNGEASFNGSQYFGSIMTRYMFVKGKVDKSYTGIIDLGSKYVYLVNGETAKNISGLTEIENDIYLLKNGEASFNGSQYFGSIMTRYMFVKGKVDKSYTGIIDLGSKYVYLVNGETAKNISGLTEVENDIYLLKNGEAIFNGSQYFGSTKLRYIFINGKVDKNFNDIYEIPTALIKMKAGITDIYFNGPYLYNSNIYTFKDGVYLI